MDGKIKQGSTLLEALMAVAILGVGIAGASKLVVSTMRISDLAKARNTAVSIAKSRFEQLSMSAFDDLAAWSVTNLVVNGRGLPAVDGHFQLTAGVAYPQTNLAEIAISVKIRNRTTWEFDTAPETLTTYLSH